MPFLDVRTARRKVVWMWGWLYRDKMLQKRPFFARVRQQICIRQIIIAEIGLNTSHPVNPLFISESYNTFFFVHLKADNACLLSFGHPYC
ncbi:hypothetical protein N5C39_00655 [Enterobacter bugandensis]|uniref:Uncharacterized protein n=1 Tax=Enterobacter bugandensis TaxID=881260 RepID=A0AA42PLV8_9ENTR|nr:hypothetical protein [Enterobacter bugandensis]MDH1316881.1 hypothetical protein [Enterobacter bugandensis]